MRRIKFSRPEIGFMAGTRGMLGAGIGLLLAERVKKYRKGIGWTLLGIGALTTIPIVRKVMKG